MTTAGQVIDAEWCTRMEKPPIAVLKQTVSQSVPNATWGIITFDAEDVDTYGGHSTTSNTSRYTCQYAGWYRIGGRAAFAANATGSRGARVHINGNYIPGAATLAAAAPSPVSRRPTTSSTSSPATTSRSPAARTAAAPCPPQSPSRPCP